ncbi:MAG: SPOR domain-containing protein [Gammaproteobacteria bacterium]
MNAQVSDNQSKAGLKQRLVGILVLCGFAVVAFHVLQDIQKDSAHAIKGTNIPPKPENFHVEVLPLADFEPNASESSVSGENEIQTQPVVSDTDNAERSNVISLPAKKGSVAGAVTGLKKPGAWVVQVGSFKDETNAYTLRDQLREKGFASNVEKMTAAGEQIYRVIVGPELLKSKAEATRKQLSQRESLDGIVVEIN